jgi:hypothetical protein
VAARSDATDVIKRAHHAKLTTQPDDDAPSLSAERTFRTRRIEETNGYRARVEMLSCPRTRGIRVNTATFQSRPAQKHKGTQAPAANVAPSAHGISRCWKMQSKRCCSTMASDRVGHRGEGILIVIQEGESMTLLASKRKDITQSPPETARRSLEGMERRS